MADVAPEPVKLGTPNLVVLHEHLFHGLDVRSGFIEPGEDGIFFEAFNAGEATDTATCGDQRQRLDDLFFVGSLAVEERAVVLVEGAQAAFAAEALLALAGLAKMMVPAFP